MNKKMKITSFLDWACKKFLEEDHQAMVMKFKLGRHLAKHEITFICAKKTATEMIYGWSDIQPPLADVPRIYYCCNDPLTSPDSEKHLEGILSKIRDCFDDFPAPDMTRVFDEYKIIYNGEGSFSIKI